MRFASIGVGTEGGRLPQPGKVFAGKFKQLRLKGANTPFLFKEFDESIYIQEIVEIFVSREVHIFANPICTVLNEQILQYSWTRVFYILPRK